MILFLWKGKGWLVAACTFGAMLVAQLLTGWLKEPAYWDAHGWPKAVGFIAASGLVGAVAKQRPDRGDSLFFVPLKYWSPILVVGAVVALILG